MAELRQVRPQQFLVLIGTQPPCVPGQAAQVTPPVAQEEREQSYEAHEPGAPTSASRAERKQAAAWASQSSPQRLQSLSEPTHAPSGQRLQNGFRVNRQAGVEHPAKRRTQARSPPSVIRLIVD